MESQALEVQYLNSSELITSLPPTHIIMQLEKVKTQNKLVRQENKLLKQQIAYLQGLISELALANQPIINNNNHQEANPHISVNATGGNGGSATSQGEVNPHITAKAKGGTGTGGNARNLLRNAQGNAKNTVKINR